MQKLQTIGGEQLVNLAKPTCHRDTSQNNTKLLKKH